MMLMFKLHWLDGKTQVIEGYDLADALRRAGIGVGALAALDFSVMVKSFKEEDEMPCTVDAAIYSPGEVLAGEFVSIPCKCHGCNKEGK